MCHTCPNLLPLNQHPNPHLLPPPTLILLQICVIHVPICCHWTNILTPISYLPPPSSCSRYVSYTCPNLLPLMNQHPNPHLLPPPTLILLQICVIHVPICCHWTTILPLISYFPTSCSRYVSYTCPNLLPLNQHPNPHLLPPPTLILLQICVIHVPICCHWTNILPPYSYLPTPHLLPFAFASCSRYVSYMSQFVAIEPTS